MSSKPEREKRKWWVSDDGVVSQQIGYSCAPQNPKQWFIPKLGFTFMEGYSLYPTREEAVKNARKELKNMQADIKTKLAALESQPAQEGGEG